MSDAPEPIQAITTSAPPDPYKRTDPLRTYAPVLNPLGVIVIFFGLLVHQTIEEVHRIVLDGAALTALNATAQGNLLATVTGLADIGTIDTGGDATVRGGSVVIGDGVSGGLALITATAGDVDLGTWDAQGFFDIDADGSVTFDSVTGRLVEVIAGGDITGNFAASDVNLISGRPRNVTLDAGGAVSIGEARSIGNVLLDGTSVDAGIVNAAGTGTFTATGLVAIDDLTTGGSTENATSELLTHGGWTGTPLALASAANIASFSVFAMSRVIEAARNSSRKFALR